MKKLTSLLICLMATITLWANDGVYYTSGNQLVPTKETNITVKKEILTISIQDDGYATVDVYYEFYNPDSRSKTVTMGFEAAPPYNDDDKFYANGVHPYIKNFTVEMNNQKLRYRNAVCEEGLPNGVTPVQMDKWKFYDEAGNTLYQGDKDNPSKTLNFCYVYYFNATFKPGQNIVHHTYSYLMSQSVGTSYSVFYKLSPAMRWGNHQIDDFTLVIRAENTTKHFVIPQSQLQGGKFSITPEKGKMRKLEGAYNKFFEFVLRNGQVKWQKKNLSMTPDQAGYYEELSIGAADEYYVYGKGGSAKHYCGEYYDPACRTSMMGYEEEMQDKEFIEPRDKAFRKRVMKNIPYAYRGHIFKDAKLKAYFERMFWYMPDPSYKDDTSKFTETDWECIKKGK